ncbi:uncharacterized protein AB9W97_016409 isoform 1-T1 [Spinachia spinachia]
MCISVLSLPRILFLIFKAHIPGSCTMAGRCGNLLRDFFLRQVTKFNLPKTMMVTFYMAIMESILCSSITVCIEIRCQGEGHRGGPWPPNHPNVLQRMELTFDADNSHDSSSRMASSG